MPDQVVIITARVIDGQVVAATVEHQQPFLAPHRRPAPTKAEYLLAAVRRALAFARTATGGRR